MFVPTGELSKWLCPVLAALFAACAVRTAPAGTQTEGAPVLTPVPVCPDASRPISRLGTEELARARWRTSAFGVRCSPFAPSLTAASDGALLLVWAPESAGGVLRYPGEEDWGALGGVHSRLLGPEGWTQDTLVSDDTGLSAQQAEVTSLGQDAWLVYWYEPGLVGRRLAGTVWSEPRRLPDRDVYAVAAEVVGDAAGEARAFWIDTREHHFTPSLLDPYPGYEKIFTRSFDDPPDAPAEQVTRPGQYDATLMAVVRRWLPGNPEIVFFRHRGKSDPTLLSGYNDLYLTRRLENRWTDPAALLMHAHGDRREHVQNVLAFRDGDDRLIVVYAGDDDIRVLGEDERNRRVVSTIARSAGSVFGGTTPLAAAIGPDGIVSVVYRAAPAMVFEGTRQRALAPGEGALILLRTDGVSCLDTAVLTDRLPRTPLFDVAVDADGRTHVVYVLADGPDAVLAHAVLGTPIRAVASRVR